MSAQMKTNRQSAIRLGLRAGALGLLLLALGEAGHHVLEHAHQEIAHHLFHILFGAGAILVFGLYMFREVRRNGWPRFTWRLRAEVPTADKAGRTAS